jgi:hypothetical protein
MSPFAQLATVLVCVASGVPYQPYLVGGGAGGLDASQESAALALTSLTSHATSAHGATPDSTATPGLGALLLSAQQLLQAVETDSTRLFSLSEDDAAALERARLTVTTSDCSQARTLVPLPLPRSTLPATGLRGASSMASALGSSAGSSRPVAKVEAAAAAAAPPPPPVAGRPGTVGFAKDASGPVGTPVEAAEAAAFGSTTEGTEAPTSPAGASAKLGAAVTRVGDAAVALVDRVQEVREVVSTVTELASNFAPGAGQELCVCSCF